MDLKKIGEKDYKKIKIVFGFKDIEKMSILKN